MAVLETIRVKFGVLISVLIGIALLSFIIDPNMLGSCSTNDKVGEINGKTISYLEFQREIEKMTVVNEISTGSSVMDEEQHVQLRNAVWQKFLNTHMFIKNAKAAGINVTTEEVAQSIQTLPFFLDQNGMFSQMHFDEFMAQKEGDQSGRLQIFWENLLEELATQLYYQKYNSLFVSSNITNPLMLQEEIAGNNNTFSADFVMLPYGYEQDTTIVVSDKEIIDYYKAHKKFYKQEASRDIEYVVFDVKPSETDVAETKEAIVSVVEEFATTADMKQFLMMNSEKYLDEAYYKVGQLNSVSRVVNDYSFGPDSGKASDILVDGDSFYAVRVLDTKMLPDSAFVRHILLSPENSGKADSLINLLNTRRASFADLATEFSLDANPNVATPGDIGWLTSTQIIPGFESVFGKTPNKPFVLDTRYGKHIVEVTQKTSPILKKQVAILSKTARPSRETIAEVYSKANTFAVKASKGYEEFTAAVQECGVYAHPLNKLAEGTNKLGSLDNTKEVSRWAYDAKKGDVSRIFTIGNSEHYVVAVLKNIHKKGYTPVEQVSPMIENILYREKLAEKKTAEVAEKIAGLNDLDAIAETLGTTVSSKEGLAFASMSTELDSKFIGAASVAEIGEISAPLAGNIGVYVYKVTGREPKAFYTEDDAKQQQTQMSYYSTQMILPTMMEAANVEDNRARFF